jgi:hypothetical protein
MILMLKISVDVQGKFTTATLEGQIDETFSMATDLPSPGANLDIHCAKINRINSTGVKKWMLYIQGIMKWCEVRFFAISPAMVEQFNLISNFGGTGEVMSVLLPYECGQCGENFSTVRTVAELRLIHGQIHFDKCPKCANAKAEFDDIPEEYLQFLKIT